jgi:RHS repeat-associated protein
MTSDKNGKYTSSYTYGLNRISVKTLGITDDKYTPLYYHYDGRGSVTSLVNTADQTEAKYRYDAFGVPKPGLKIDTYENGFVNSYGYNGENYDKYTELQYLRARYYEPESGRFLTRDSYLGNVMNPLTLNRYAYTGNDPVMYKDPSGHIWTATDDGHDTPEQREVALSYMNASHTVLQLGDSGGEVQLLQQRLIERGYDLGGSGADGQFGPATQAAVEQFQQGQGIGVNGIAGRKTETALLAARAIARDVEEEKTQEEYSKSQNSSSITE